MATLAITLTETGQTTLSKTYTVADADVDKVTAAFQSDANSFVNGTATRAQVWLYILSNVWNAALQAKVQSNLTVPATVPTPISIT